MDDSERFAASEPVTYGQRALWYLHRLAPDASAYNIGGAARVRGGLDLAALEAAFQALVDRHPALRTRFEAVDGEPRARVLETVPFALGVSDAPAGEAALAERLAAVLAAPFDLSRAPLLRVEILRPSTPDGDHAMALAMHHIIGDFWSLGVLLRELAALYDARRAGRAVELAPLALDNAAVARREQAMLAGPRGARLDRYWRARLAPPLPQLDLPADRPRPARQRFRGGRAVRLLEPRAVASLASLATGRGGTPFMAILALFQTLLHRLSGQPRVLVGTPTANRRGRDMADLVGYHVNPVVLDADFADDPSVAELVARARKSVLGALRHRDLPLPLLVERLAPERDPSRSPIFQAMLVYQQDAYGMGEAGLAALALGARGTGVALGSLELEPVALPQTSAQLDVTLTAAEIHDGRLALELDYDADLFDAATAERMLGQLEVLIEAAAADPDAPVSALPLLDDAERRRLLIDWNPPVSDGEAACLHALVAAQAARTPEAEALVVGEARYSYRQLAAASRRLARHLRGLGVGPEIPVGVCAPRSAALVVGLLGVLEAGGAYVPLDPAYPGERLAFILDDAEVPVLLVEGSSDAALPADHPATRVDLAAFAPGSESAGDPGADGMTGDAPAVDPDGLAYVIYTSGSTGRPKGVAISHRNAATLVRWARGVFSADDLRGVLAATSICFDLSVFELFVPLATGGKVVLADNALALPHLPAAGEVTLVNTVPSAIAELVAGERHLPPSVRVVNLAGEPLTGALARRVLTHAPGARLFDLYGPSEDTTYSTYAEFRADEGDGEGEPTIGRAIDASRAYVVDRHLRPVPVGVPGELLLGGAGLARGYLGRPVLTAERFVPDPFAGEAGCGDPGSRLYRTGDLVKWLPDGRLAFLGRLDHQVKIRGFRIELGEIEVALGALPGVEEAVVMARSAGGDIGDSLLVAYVLASAGEERPEAEQLRIALSERLPAFMVPQRFLVLDQMPRTPNGKVDRKALAAAPLPEPDRAHLSAGGDDGYIAPSTEVEEALAAIWRDVLGVERVGVYDSFFALGGHSLLAVRILSRVQEAFDVEVPIHALLERPTVHGLAEAIAEALLADLDEDTRAAVLAELGD